MKTILTLIFINTFPIICAFAAVYLAVNNNDSWGWFLFAGVITLVTISGFKYTSE